jgi:indole-3-glycerol phosphate synthase
MPLSPLFNTIITATQARVEERIARVSRADIVRASSDAPQVRSFEGALRATSFSVIAEHKRRSPSSGDMNPVNVEAAYATYGRTSWISAISVLTDVDHFKGSVDELRSAREACPDKPILRKDFIIDEYQIYEARAYGADAVLLMAALHADDRMKFEQLFALTQELGMAALVELGMGGDDPAALREIVPERAAIWGVNSRKFEGSAETARLSREQATKTGADSMISLALHAQLRRLIPAHKIAIAESGMRTADDLISARAADYRAALIGTAFLKGPRSINEVVAAFAPVFSTNS